MSLVTALLFNAPPPEFTGTAHTHFIDEYSPLYRRHHANTYDNRKNAPTRYRDALRALGGRATSREIAEHIDVIRPAANRYILSKKDELFRQIGVTDSPSGGRPAIVWEWIGD